jgi:hypothetical protein
MQFCFVTTPEVVAAAPAFQDLFQHRVEVGAFDGIEALHGLIGSSCKVNGHAARPEDVFTLEAIEAIWRISRGFPFYVQLLCQRSIKRALGLGNDQVTLADVLDVVSLAGISDALVDV